MIQIDLKSGFFIFFTFKIMVSLPSVALFHYYYLLKLINFFFWLRQVFVAARGLSLVAVSEGYSLLRFAGFSLRWLLLLWSMGSRHAGFSSCGTWAQ